MPATIALHWTETELHYVLVQDDGQVEAAADVALKSDIDSTAIGQLLAEALAPYSPGRAKVIVALGRKSLQWQHLLLPPCSADELPDVVRLQVDHDLSPTDEEIGFDFLPLVGDEQTPYQVLTVALTARELEKIRQVCRAANLTLQRIVPLAAGWPALTEQASPRVKRGTQIFVAPQAHEATLWATRAGRVVLFRQFQLATSEDQASSAATLGSELRRTLLALSQHAESQHAENGKPTISLVSVQREQLTVLAKTLEEQLDVSVQSLAVTAQHRAFTHQASFAPLAGLAIDQAKDHPPLVDLLHPRRRPQAKVNVRTYALASAAAMLLVTWLGWTSYAKLNAPLHQAAADRAELTLLEKSLEELKTDEQRAAAIRDWNAVAPNLLLHLQQVSKSIRPQTLGDEGFLSDQDVVLEKLDFDKRQLTLEALARNSRAVQPLEARLRASAYRPQRIKSDPSETIKEYPWHWKSTIEITTASDSFDSAADSAASKNPQRKKPEDKKLDDRKTEEAPS